MSDDFADLSDYDLAALLFNPLGQGSPFMPTEDFVEADETRERVRHELKRRGYTDGHLRLIEKRNYAPIDRRLNY